VFSFCIFEQNITVVWCILLLLVFSIYSPTGLGQEPRTFIHVKRPIWYQIHAPRLSTTGVRIHTNILTDPVQRINNRVTQFSTQCCRVNQVLARLEHSFYLESWLHSYIKLESHVFTNTISNVYYTQTHKLSGQVATHPFQCMSNICIIAWKTCKLHLVIFREKLQFT
jgi:hypothetical protein